MPDEDSVPNEVVEMPDQHSLGYIGNAPTQFTGAQGSIGKPPQNRPFPAPVDDGQHGINRAGRYLLLRYRHISPTSLLTYLSVHLSESAYIRWASEIQERIMNILNVATILCIGLLIGAELAVSAFINPVVWKLDLAAQARAFRLFGRRLGRAMPVWYIASLLLLVSETITHRHESHVGLLGVAIAFWGAAIALSLLSLVPINNRMVRLDADGWTESAQRELRKWDGLHRVRVAVLAVAMIFFLAGLGI
jgi:Domain of unknown function (DUF1772)